MKLILNYLLNKIAVLCVFDIAIVFWIIWYEGRIQYEPLLEQEYSVLSEMGLPTIPLSEVIYNTIITAIVINMIVIVFESRKLRHKKFQKYDLAIAFAYFSLIMFCMLCGCFYISSRTHGDIINEFNPLFRFPIWVIGKEVFTGAVTVPKLYLSLCVIHWFICSFYAYMCIYYAVGRYDLRIESRKGRKKHAEDVPQQH